MKPIVTAAALLLAATPALAEGKGPSYTAEQAARGAEVYTEFCLQCHGPNLLDGHFGAPIRGSFFRERWAGKSVAELMQFMAETMPPEDPGYLYPEEYADVLAYIMQRNDVAEGGSELPADPEASSDVVLTW